MLVELLCNGLPNKLWYICVCARCLYACARVRACVCGFVTVKYGIRCRGWSVAEVIAEKIIVKMGMIF